MNDIVLSSLVNLLALFSAAEKTDIEESKKILSTYLTNHFGVRSQDSYICLYEDLRGFYDDGIDTDGRRSIVMDICEKLVALISVEEQNLMLLRLMEICSANIVADTSIGLFHDVADAFGIGHERCDEFRLFISGESESNSVKIIRLEGIGGYITTLYLEDFDILIFSCHTDDLLRMNDVPLLPNTFHVWQRSGVLKSSKTRPLYYYQAKARYGGGDNYSGKACEISVKGKDINFVYPKGNNGIHNLSFGLYSGELVAVMGGSGAGKSTLLSLLNGTMVPQSGCITINGHDISEPKVKELIGFVPQDDLLIEELTVYQNLWFTGKLCFDGMAEDELDKKVCNVLDELGLMAAKDLKVGSPLNKFISGGQRKRLNIALELIREPAILFLDEPTSGLSSADAEMLVNLLKVQAFKGKIVVSIIHQPSSDVYKLFDRLWILDRGGFPVYDGNPIEAITYFKTAANYADADMSTCPTCGNVNPEIIFNIIDEKALSETGKVLGDRKVSPEEWHQRYLDDKQKRKQQHGTIGKKKIINEDLPENNQRKPGLLKQIAIYLHRNLKMKMTNLQYILITLLEAPILALICASLTRYAPPEGYSIMDNINLTSYFFMSIIVATLLGMSGSAEEIFKDRALLKREKFLSLSYSSYIWSKIIFMAFVSLVQSLLFILVGSSIMGINGMFGVWLLILFIASFLAGLTGLWLSQTLNSVVAIYITIPLLLIPQILLCGMVVTFAELTPNSTTGNVPVLGDVIPSRWAFEALAVTSFSDNEYEKNFFEQDKERYMAQYYDHVYLYEMKSQLETLHDKQLKGEKPKIDHMEVIKNSLPQLAKVCNIKQYSGNYSYQSLKDYFEQASKVLSDRGNKTTLALDKQVSAMIRTIGKDAMSQLKRDNYNIRLETLVLNSSDSHLCKVVNGHIVPNSGFVFVEPTSANGRAPFYSSEKIVGEWHIKTLWYNIFILIMMCVGASLCLFFEFPGKLLRK
ncbi:MAG: ATP-binding cassette domain-containing protein [Bacteroidaceae bacterium]|nr:ATP-binding cassette domain-containing protein [Bacteroidaceae bacterium]